MFVKLIKKKIHALVKREIDSNNKKILGELQEKNLLLENQIYALTELISTKEPARATTPSFKEEVINFFQDGISSPMFKTYVEYALRSIDRGNKMVEKYHSYLSENFEYLDIGCAYGGSVIAMINAGASRAVGIDVDNKLLELASIQADNYEVGDRSLFLNVDLQDCEQVSSLGNFDFITCIDVLEHVLDPRKSIESLALLCRTNGKLIVDIPNPYSPFWIKQDPHHHLFGTVLLEREDAIEQFVCQFGKLNYLVGHFNDLKWYESEFEGAGFKTNYLGVSYESSNDWLTVRSEIEDLLNNFEERFVDNKWTESIRSKINDAMNDYRIMFNKDITEMGDRQLFIKYGIPVYHLLCTKE
ncbi:class I SAM-dependent methyltransferase [Paenibacillus lautus]|uniref:Methyltransferase domain-containing protein n=1 Tax=Paenibacillus lautus TaxID=1401 RepID=A0A385TUM3_PAELA|nr:methyltransferase domain-containing protein [Paenibacillus lautus]AYB47121.1 methyltransferase domain-containing protein [Paenibacillus lautus]